MHCHSSGVQLLEISRTKQKIQTWIPLRSNNPHSTIRMGRKFTSFYSKNTVFLKNTYVARQQAPLVSELVSDVGLHKFLTLVVHIATLCIATIHRLKLLQSILITSDRRIAPYGLRSKRIVRQS